VALSQLLLERQNPEHRIGFNIALIINKAPTGLIFDVVYASKPVLTKTKLEFVIFNILFWENPFWFHERTLQSNQYLRLFHPQSSFERKDE